MAPEDKSTILWDLEKGIITLNRSGNSERVILMRKEYMLTFFEEAVRTIGNDGFRVILRNIAKKAGAPKDIIDDPTLGSLRNYLKSAVLPVDIGQSKIPEAINWDGSSVKVGMFADTYWYIVPIKFVLLLNEAMIDVLSENGARAIYRSTARQATLGMSEKFLSNYGWNSLDEAMPAQDKKVFRESYRMVGWCNAKSVSRKGDDGEWILAALCDNTYESEGVKSTRPACVGLISYMEGYYEGMFAKTTGKAVTSREVKCRAKGDPYCLHVYKFRDKNAEPTDWGLLENQWRALEEELKNQ